MLNLYHYKLIAYFIRIFFPALVLFCCMLFDESLSFSSLVSSVLVHSLGNSKAAAHVAVDLQC